MANGRRWVLLDEINLASKDTLECLSTIVELNSSIDLLERGKFVPIKRYPNFTLLASISTQISVRRMFLVGIRNRIIEFFMNKLTTENDLVILGSTIWDYKRPRSYLY